jgi:hypothetical protein
MMPDASEAHGLEETSELRSFRGGVLNEFETVGAYGVGPQQGLVGCVQSLVGSVQRLLGSVHCNLLLGETSECAEAPQLFARIRRFLRCKLPILRFLWHESVEYAIIF